MLAYDREKLLKCVCVIYHKICGYYGLFELIQLCQQKEKQCGVSIDLMELLTTKINKINILEQAVLCFVD